MTAEIASFLIACFKRSLAFKTRTMGELGEVQGRGGDSSHQGEVQEEWEKRGNEGRGGGITPGGSMIGMYFKGTRERRKGGGITPNFRYE